jgi:hypothetical protein
MEHLYNTRLLEKNTGEPENTSTTRHFLLKTNCDMVVQVSQNSKLLRKAKNRASEIH